jgi:hypothetical protein
LGGQLTPGHADDGEPLGKEPVDAQVVQRGQELAPVQIARPAKDHDRAWIGRAIELAAVIA